jgi:hypothetical protein
VSDDTSGTLGTPIDDRSGPDTPGPDATPEQAAYVAGLLGSLRADDPAIPDHVATRIDAVLAELRRAEPAGSAPAAALADGDEATAGSRAGGDGSPSATVLPLPARRASGTSRTFRWVVGAAAAVVVVGAGAAVVRGGLSGSDSSGGTAVMAEDAAGDRGAAPIRTSGTDYRSDDLAAQAQALVAKALDGSGAPVAPAETPEVVPTDAASPGTASRDLLSDATLAACLEQLTGGPGATPLAVDQGSYEGKPADVVVLPSPDDAARLEVWVVGPGCTRESVELYEFRTIPSPGAPGGTGAGSTEAPAPGESASPGTAP